ncbi:hypothetical protein BVG79_01110 [Ketogulonicigenium robustum]|uniref:Uncharacterized protein n=1 Tax=Ketogulonicigenium robustum TaxID=92947 RepID=A0A1W6NYX7_9RHOB|nr:hypothetical protein BVG79_01110 [Ketogulonicigenium robustum]
MNLENVPAPRSTKAQAQGCRCEVRNVEPQDYAKWPNWLTRGCHLHDATWLAARHGRT